jgi:hypothetical protein
MNHVPRTDLVAEVLQVVAVARILHCIEMIQIAEEFIDYADSLKSPG